MRTRSPQTGTAARALLCALVVSTSGCSTFNETPVISTLVISFNEILIQPLHLKIWFPAFVLLAGLIVCGLSWLAWREALRGWELPNVPKPGAKWWLKGWTPFLAVIAISGWFAIYNFLNPLPMSPDLPMLPQQRLWNVGACLLGSLIGVGVGWRVGREIACRRFKK